MDQDRPGKTRSDDKLGRQPFVEQLCGSLVTTGADSDGPGKSTGLVVGLAGEWGSGKSTILNFVEEVLREKHDPIAIVRFDPWLISGRDDLIRSFFDEFAQEIRKGAPTSQDQVDDLLEKIGQYGGVLDIGVDYLPLPEEARKQIKAARKALFSKSGGGLHDLKQQIMTRIGKLDFPIVVLIDEVDRVDDNEIKTLVQLVKSVADFPNVSYLIAYDTTRVVQALGASAPGGEETERGRGYLEKIVQLQVPVPAIFDSEMTESLIDALNASRGELFLPENFAGIKRFTVLTELLFGRLVRTPRDMKRLLGVFRALRGMTGDEMDWVDVLGYASLVCKVPDITEKIQRDPLFFAEEYRNSERFYRERPDRNQQDSPQFEEDAIGQNWGNESYGHVLRFLFRRLRPENMQANWLYQDEDDAVPARISRYRALSILVRHGMPPGTWSLQEIRDLVAAVCADNMGELEDALNSDREQDLLLLLEMRPTQIPGQDLLAFWLKVGQWLQKPDDEIPVELDPKWRWIHILAAVAASNLSKHAEFGTRFWDLVHGLRQNGAEFLSGILRRVAQAHGLFDMRQQGDLINGISEAELATKCATEAKSIITAHRAGNWLFSNWTMMPVFMMSNFGLWTDDERERLREITEDRHAFHALTMMLFSGDHAVDRDSLDRIFGWAGFERRLLQNMGDHNDETLSPDIRHALEKAHRLLIQDAQ